MAGEIDVDPFISHRITLDEVNKGFDLMHAQDGIRSVIEFPPPGPPQASRPLADLPQLAPAVSSPSAVIVSPRRAGPSRPGLLRSPQ